MTFKIRFLTIGYSYGSQYTLYQTSFATPPTRYDIPNYKFQIELDNSESSKNYPPWTLQLNERVTIYHLIIYDIFYIAFIKSVLPRKTFIQILFRTNICLYIFKLLSTYNTHESLATCKLTK